jgi:hypothetical protein
LAPWFGLLIAGLATQAAPPKIVVADFTTWDADLVNVEGLSQTGEGVYVAVLDTGLVPNWRDYFPENRIATDLGTGFDHRSRSSRISIRANRSRRIRPPDHLGVRPVHHGPMLSAPSSDTTTEQL